MSNNLILRAWDKKARKMREVDSVAFHSAKSIGDCSNNRLPKVVNLWGFNIMTQQDIIIHREIKDVELMQYSGVEDISGIRIFAGDIVKTKYGDIGIVEYSTYFLEWRIIFYLGRDHLIRYKEYGVAMFDFIYPKIHLKVIGNKYENDIKRDFKKEIPAC